LERGTKRKEEISSTGGGKGKKKGGYKKVEDFVPLLQRLCRGKEKCYDPISKNLVLHKKKRIRKKFLSKKKKWRNRGKGWEVRSSFFVGEKRGESPLLAN